MKETVYDSIDKIMDEVERTAFNKKQMEASMLYNHYYRYSGP
jgi:hypothetical protein